MSLGRVWAVLDKHEEWTSKPMTATELKRIALVCRKQLREWERQGRLDVYYVTDAKGTREKAYMRPKERDGVEKTGGHSSTFDDSYMAPKFTDMSASDLEKRLAELDAQEPLRKEKIERLKQGDVYRNAHKQRSE